MLLFFFFKQKTAYEIMPSLVGSEMCIRDSGSIMPASAWVVIQVSDLIPISCLQIPIFACKRYHCVQKHNTVKHGRRQPTRRVRYPDFANHSFCEQLAARTCPSTNQPDSTAVRPDMTSLIVSVREVILKHHRVTWS